MNVCLNRYYSCQIPTIKSFKDINIQSLSQRQAKYSENKLKSIKARNEYLLTLEATNASVFKYYIHDLSDLIDVSICTFVFNILFFFIFKGITLVMWIAYNMFIIYDIVWYNLQIFLLALYFTK